MKRDKKPSSLKMKLINGNVGFKTKQFKNKTKDN